MNNRILAGLLAIFCGTIGLHKFLLNKNMMGILYILFSWTLIPTIIGVVEGIKYLMMNDSEFAEKYFAPSSLNQNNTKAKQYIIQSNESKCPSMKYGGAKFFLQGVAGQLYVYDNKIVLERKGILGTIIHCFAGSKTIPFKYIHSVQLREATSLINGFIQFGIAGGIERRGGLINAADDENSLFFEKENNELALQIRNYIEDNIVL